MKLYRGLFVLTILFFLVAFSAWYVTINNRIHSVKQEISKLLKEDCLLSGGTSVEQPAGNFIKCIN